MSRSVAVVLCIAAAPVRAADIADLHCLAGCWIGGGAERSVEEIRINPAGGTMLGMSRAVSGDRSGAWELMRIEESGGASFPSVSVTAYGIVFENPAHYFPQREIYRRDGEALLGRIEGDVDGTPQSVDFPVRAGECPGS